ncbi:hypothetical protein F5Y16DRAFT_370171 [Xylariaceae sp. FL0255]|nr:hypothetical protein F5Y16DRAFT_370171 [Xylariaceae sp. FL0255]
MATPPSADGAAAPSSFTLRILSPSVGVPQPFVFDSLPTTTTVQQLKEKVRNSMHTKPPDQLQRLIHRGRLLTRDNESMIDVFGGDAIRSSVQQVLHLVISSPTDENAPAPPTTSTSASSQPPNAQNQPQTAGHHQHHHHHHHPFHNQLPQVRIGIGGAPGHPGIAFGIPQPHIAGLTPFQQQQLQNHHQILSRLAGPTPNHNPNQPATGHLEQGTATPGRNASPHQPDSTRTVIREGIGPDGQRWRTTVNESVITIGHGRAGQSVPPFPTSHGPFPPPPPPRSVPNGGPLAGVDLQNILRSADASSASRTMADAMRRNASSSSLVNLANQHGQQPIAPGVTTPLIPSRNGSAAASPDPFRAAGRSMSTSAGIPTNAFQSSSRNPEVYILSSPSGPRALLVNGSADMYYTPQGRILSNSMGLPIPPVINPIAPAGAPSSRHALPPQILPRSSNPPRSPFSPRPNDAAPGQQMQGQPQQGAEQAAGDIPQLHVIHQPQVQAIRLAHIWPHFWMITRLALFIWWFTSPSSSWLRWFTVISIAITLFILNTGVLNPIAEQVWVPMRRALENLIPMAVEHGEPRPLAPENPQNGADNAADPARPRNPDPSEAAARLVRRRQTENANWLMNQARRLERAGILFIASLAPGLAEGHIAQIEAEARAAEQQRRQETEAAAAAAAAAAEAVPPSTENIEGNSANDTVHDSTTTGEASGSQAQPSEGEVRQRQVAAQVDA